MNVGWHICFWYGSFCRLAEVMTGLGVWQNILSIHQHDTQLYFDVSMHIIHHHGPR